MISHPLKSSNPIFKNSFWSDFKSSDSKMSISGIIIKTLAGLLIIAAITVWVWNLQEQGYLMRWFTIGGMLTAAVVSLILSFKKEWVAILLPVYVVAKGFFLGGFSSYAHQNFPDLPYQAIGVTIITFIVMLLLYQFKVVTVTKKFRSVVISAAATIFAVYLLSFILGLMGIKTYLWGNSWWAIAFNIIAAVVATLALLLDFDFIERHKNKATKQHEWLAVWGLLATLIWLYIEILRLMQRFAKNR